MRVARRWVGFRSLIPHCAYPNDRVQYEHQEGLWEGIRSVVGNEDWFARRWCEVCADEGRGRRLGGLCLLGWGYRQDIRMRLSENVRSDVQPQYQRMVHWQADLSQPRCRKISQ